MKSKSLRHRLDDAFKVRIISALMRGLIAAPALRRDHQVFAASRAKRSAMETPWSSFLTNQRGNPQYQVGRGAWYADILMTLTMT
jgi:hypothetical protein